MMTRGHFAGEFVVTDDECCYSIGDCLEVVLKDHAYPTGETFTIPMGGGGEKTVHIAAMPLTVTLSALTEPIEVLLKMTVGRSFRHWLDCLEIGVPSVVIPHKYARSKYTWYMPKIDGWVPSGLIGGRTKAQSTTNRRKNNA
jgi:hypothetical protein